MRRNNLKMESYWSVLLIIGWRSPVGWGIQIVRVTKTSYPACKSWNRTANKDFLFHNCALSLQRRILLRSGNTRYPFECQSVHYGRFLFSLSSEASLVSRIPSRICRVHSSLKISALNRLLFIQDFLLGWLVAWLAFDTLLMHFRWANESEEPVWVRKQLFLILLRLNLNFDCSDSKSPKASVAGSEEGPLNGSQGWPDSRWLHILWYLRLQRLRWWIQWLQA